MRNFTLTTFSSIDKLLGNGSGLLEGLLQRNRLQFVRLSSCEVHYPSISRIGLLLNLAFKRTPPLAY
jgi:hypothetical protein